MTGIHEGAGALLASVDYDPAGRPAILTRGAGVAITAYYYYATGWPWLIGHNLAGGAANDLVLGFSYNPAGQISQTSRENVSDLYAWAGHYAVARPYTTDGLNRYGAAGGATFGYDANGNLISDGSRTYSYDIENRLIGASGGVQLGYDPAGEAGLDDGDPELLGTTSDTAMPKNGRFPPFFQTFGRPEDGSLVPRRGLEPPRPCERQHLKLVRLPIPPSGPREQNNR